MINKLIIDTLKSLKIHVFFQKYSGKAATYDPPIKLERAISAKLSPKSNSDNIYSDDSVEDIITAFEGVDTTIISGWFTAVPSEPLGTP